jgi:peptidoglycan hydrolase-like protein with peptidoglycan-binding domain
MPLPVLEKNDHQYAPSDWVAYAGRALQQAGYLQAEPTGLYDDEFTAGLAAFQADHGISEEDQVGPYTWAALGIEDTEAEGEEAEYPVQPGDLSEDGQWRWNGEEWVAAAAEPAAGGGNPEDAVEVSFNDEVDGPETDEAPAPDVDDIGDIDALWRTESTTAPGLENGDR